MPPLPAGSTPHLQRLHDELQGFSEFGAATLVESSEAGGGGVPVYINEFWTAKQRAGHGLHEISYRACYKPQLPDFFITRCCRPGDLVYDPFMGRGTTLIQAQLRGCRAAGNDVNPLSKILCGPRLAPPSLDAVRQRLEEVPLSQTPDGDRELLVFFHPETLGEIQSWQRYFKERQAQGSFDAVDAWLQMVATNRLTGHSSGFFSVYTLPPNLAASVASQQLINEKRNQTPEYRNTKKILLKKSKNLLSDPVPAGYDGTGMVLSTASADHTPLIATDSVNLIVTSPPFLDVVNYVQDNWMRQWFCGLTFQDGMIWQCKRLNDWLERMAATLVECHRVLKPGAVLAFEVGEIRHGQLKLEHEVIRAAHGSGLVPEAIMINAQHFTKTANCWGVDNNEAGTNSNRIVIFRKPGADHSPPADGLWQPAPARRPARMARTQQELFAFP